MAVHHDVAKAVDNFLRGRELRPEIRYRDETGLIHKEAPPARAAAERNGRSQREPERELEALTEIDLEEPEVAPMRSLALQRIYSYGVGLNKLRTAAQRMGVPAQFVDDLRRADVIVTLKSYYRKRPQPIVEAEERRLPVYVLRSNTLIQMESFLADLFGVSDELGDTLDSAMREAQEAIRRVLTGAQAVDLSPQPSSVRRQQHQAARTANLISHSHGRDPYRHVRILRE
jgi:predicted RNase H-like HicB family nuclease